MPSKTYFTPAMFQFLGDLALNNYREWFQKNKARYEKHVKEPLLEFIDDFREPLKSISPHYVADPRPVGGSMFRIYRDTRFARDKTPYKTHASAHFRHGAGGDVHGPGFYLHLEPGNVMCGVGIWHPDGPTLAKLRDAIAHNPDIWKKAKTNKAYASKFEEWGESVSRPPKGYDAGHPLIEDIKRKDFVGMAGFDMDDACSPRFMQLYTDACKASAPYMEFLTRAVGLPW
ncbi:MAG: DUF2461 domain-containing protein [SAR202 cluster bacterium]|nr:DUF2461 domain-containing protein [SAR202 cluster bacterium]